MAINQKIALKQLREIEKLALKLRLAADGWDEDWKTLIATLMSARTTDKKTIPVAEELFGNYKSVKELSGASVEEIEQIIRGVNFYRTKARNINNLARILIEKYNCGVPHDFTKLIELPGVGRKTANVFLAEKGQGTIGVDTHVSFISQYLGWTKHKEQHNIEKDLQKLFPKAYWGKLNWILVRFGQTYKSRAKKRKILSGIKKLK